MYVVTDKCVWSHGATTTWSAVWAQLAKMTAGIGSSVGERWWTWRQAMTSNTQPVKFLHEAAEGHIEVTMKLEVGDMFDW